jgi:hypothetical protein
MRPKPLIPTFVIVFYLLYGSVFKSSHRLPSSKKLFAWAMLLHKSDFIVKFARAYTQKPAEDIYLFI